MPKIAVNPLRGLRILVAEDNLLIGESIRQVLVELECTVIGPIADLDEVLGAIETTPLDGALLDVQLGDANIDQAASELARRGIPFILATGRTRAGISALLANAPILSKPFDLPELERIVGKTFSPLPYA